MTDALWVLVICCLIGAICMLIAGDGGCLIDISKCR